MAMMNLERIDNLKINRKLWFWLALAAAAWLMESYDIGLIGVVLVPLHQMWHLSASTTGLMVASGTVGVALGVAPAGRLADRFGRKRVMVIALVEYSLATLATAWSPNWQWFALLRFVAGWGLGAMFPLPYTLLTELGPKHARGRLAGILDGFLSFGYFLAPLAASVTIALWGPSFGWRALFMGGGLGLVLAACLARYLPESPRWLALHGRTAAAEDILQRLEGGITSGISARQETMESMPLEKKIRPNVLGPSMRRRTIMLWISFPAILLMFYTIMTFMPTILRSEGVPAKRVDFLTALIMAASIPGKWVEAWLVEKIGRKSVIVGFSLVAAVAAVLFPMMHSVSLWVAMGLIFAFFGIAVDPAMKVFAAEQYPTEMRAAGVGYAEGWARLLGGALAPYIMALWLEQGGVAVSFDFVAAIAVAGALVVAWLGQETRGRVLEAPRTWVARSVEPSKL